MFDSTQNCWKNFNAHPCCQPFSPISAFLFKLKNICSKLKLLNFI